MTEKIVLATNGSVGSHVALDWVLERGRSMPLSLELVTVVDPGRGSAAVSSGSLRAAYERSVADVQRRVEQEAPAMEVAVSIRSGSPGPELLAASADADLLVVGTREPTGYFAGTLRHQLAAGARCPVAIVPANWKPRGGSVVTGVDDDVTSRLAMRYAAREAERLGRELIVVHGWQVSAVLAAYWLSTGANPIAEIRTAHREILDRSVQSIHAEHPGITMRDELARGSVSLALVDAAEGAELLVVGTHRRGVVPGLLLGSVAHDVLTTLPCPIVVVPHPDEAPAHATSSSASVTR